MDLGLVAKKLALIYACSENYESPEIGPDAIRWATEFAMHQTRRQLYLASTYVAENPFHAECLKLLRRKYPHRSPRRSPLRFLLRTMVSTLSTPPPGKRNASVHLLSGGEKALTAVALYWFVDRVFFWEG